MLRDFWRTSRDCPTCELWWAWCKQSRVRNLTLCWLMLWFYSALCTCFFKRSLPAPEPPCGIQASARATLEPNSEQYSARSSIWLQLVSCIKLLFLFLLSPSSSLVSCELFVSMRLIHQKQVKLSELYATLYHSLCRCLIPPLHTMFMPTTLCHDCPFC